MIVVTDDGAESSRCRRSRSLSSRSTGYGQARLALNAEALRPFPVWSLSEQPPLQFRNLRRPPQTPLALAAEAARNTCPPGTRAGAALSLR
jgi:hypothetical protein